MGKFFSSFSHGLLERLQLMKYWLEPSRGFSWCFFCWVKYLEKDKSLWNFCLFVYAPTVYFFWGEVESIELRIATFNIKKLHFFETDMFFQVVKTFSMIRYEVFLSSRQVKVGKLWLQPSRDSSWIFFCWIRYLEDDMSLWNIVFLIFFDAPSDFFWEEVQSI